MSKSKKILLSIPAMRGGGAERVMSILANNLVKNGWSVRLVTYASPDEKPFYSLHKDVELVQLNCLSPCKYAKPIELLKRFFKFRTEVKAFQPGVVLSFLDTNNILTVLAMIGIKIPVIVSERINPKITEISYVKKVARDWAYKKSDILLVQNKGIKSCFSDPIQRHTEIIPNPVLGTESIDWQGKNNEFISVGRLDKQKGHKYLIEAFYKINKKYPDWKLKILGEGIERQGLEALIVQYKLQNKVLLPGPSSKAIQEIVKSKIFVFPSLYEGMPNALMEAMSIGMPVIGADCEFGPSDLIKSGDNGLLVPVKNSDKLAEAMDHLASDETLQKKLGKKAKESMKKYSVDKIMIEWNKVLEEVIKKYE